MGCKPVEEEEGKPHAMRFVPNQLSMRFPQRVAIAAQQSCT
jgi:hypothetical protein